MAKLYKVRKKCMICGNVFYPKYAGSLYCEDCKNKKKEEAQKQKKLEEKQKKEKKSPKTKKPKKELTKQKISKKSKTKRK